MITADLLNTIREQISDRITVESTGNQSCMVYMPLIFDDGDPCEMAVEKTDSGQWMLTDHGLTVRRASYIGANLLSAGHVERFQQLAGFYGVSEDDGALSLESDEANLGRSIFKFTQACLELVGLAKLPKERQDAERTDFAKRLSTVVESVIPEDRRFAKWHHPDLDPERVYTVDYRIIGKTSDVYLFGVTNKIHASRATVACYHYKKEGADFQSVAIYDHEEKLPVRDTVPLNEVVDRHFPRVRERAAIREFLKSVAA